MNSAGPAGEVEQVPTQGDLCEYRDNAGSEIISW